MGQLVPLRYRTPRTLLYLFPVGERGAFWGLGAQDQGANDLRREKALMLRLTTGSGSVISNTKYEDTLDL